MPQKYYLILFTVDKIKIVCSFPKISSLKGNLCTQLMTIFAVVESYKAAGFSTLHLSELKNSCWNVKKSKLCISFS